MLQTRISSYSFSSWLILALLQTAFLGVSTGFLTPLTPRCSKVVTPFSFHRLYPTKTTLFATDNSVVIISPPGGVGQVAAVHAASLGAAVRWFVVTSSDATTVALEPFALDRIQRAGGRLELAGAAVDDLLRATSNPQSALAAVAAWCPDAPAATAASLICTTDGADLVETVDASGRKASREAMKSKQQEWRNAVKVSAQQAARVLRGTQVAVVATDDADDVVDTNGESVVVDEDFGAVVGNLLGKLQNKVAIPASLTRALDDAVILRHGALIGRPESSPDFSALLNGPRRNPELVAEYTLRSVRVEPTAVIAARRRPVVSSTATTPSSSSSASSTTIQSSRHAVGEAAALVALNQVATLPGLDVCILSLTGSDPLTTSVWRKEFERVAAQQKQSTLVDHTTTSTTSGENQSGLPSQPPVLFTTEFGAVPNINRLADWLATKWAPAVLRTYDIASIRVGARPVYAQRLPDDVDMDNTARVELVWQQLVDFRSVTVGTMLVQISDDGLVATRGPGDASQGFGSIAKKPLAGEDILIRRLAEAASQAIEKGLAKKVSAAAVEAKPDNKAVPEPVAAVAVAATTPAVDQPTSSSGPSSPSEQGPRQAGARRSTERQRGRKQTSGSDSS